MSKRGDGGDGLDARYEQLRHAALHARAEAFPLGFAVFTRRGVTGWRRALTDVTADHATAVLPGSPAAMSESLPVAVTAELVDALAAVALAGTGSHRGAPIRHPNLLLNRHVRRERSLYPCSPTPPHPR